MEFSDVALSKQMTDNTLGFIPNMSSLLGFFGIKIDVTLLIDPTSNTYVDRFD